MIDARTSDAIAMAIRFNSTIYTYKEILEKANNYLQGDENTEEDHKIKTDQTNIKQKSNINIRDLEDQLAKAIQNEDYELAAKIRDQINNINN